MISPEFMYGFIPEKQSKYFLSIIHKIGKERVVKKGSSIIRNQSHPTFFFYIVEGTFKTSIVKNNKSYVLGFTFTDDVDCCPTSLLKGFANNFTIEAVQESTVLICDLKDFKKACTPDKYTLITNNIMANYISILENRLIEVMSLTAEERYLQLIQLRPGLLQEISLAHIASYLGITRERLSRIRSKYKDLT